MSSTPLPSSPAPPSYTPRIETMFAAAIFDMDGLLVDSEPSWRKAEIRVFRELLDLELSEAQCVQTMGMRIDQVVAYWLTVHPKPGRTVAPITQAIVSEMCQQMALHGEPLPGVPALVRLLEQRGLPLAVASSSPRTLIDTVLRRLQLTPLFGVVQSAEEEQHGKPDPAVYLTTARRLGVAPHDCLVFEDSVVGVDAARAAGMCVVAVPAIEQRGLAGYARANLVLESLECFTDETLEQLAATRQSTNSA